MQKQHFTSVELCAGAGGQALGLHLAGFRHRLLIELEKPACQTLETNNEKHGLGWGEIFNGDLIKFSEECSGLDEDIDLIAGGVPCPPFSKAGKQLGKADERDLFPATLKIIQGVNPKAVMIENVPGLLDPKFAPYRQEIEDKLYSLDYLMDWRRINASDFGVPQLRPRVVLVALKKEYFEYFSWPDYIIQPMTVGEALYDLMASNGWQGAKAWAHTANKIAPTLVGGSKKHGGPDLGPTRAKKAWKELHVNGHRIANEPPLPNFQGEKEGYENMPLLTFKMAARIQGFPDWWEFYGNKTASYRQVGNAFPPPVAKAVGIQISQALLKNKKQSDPQLYTTRQLNLFVHEYQDNTQQPLPLPYLASY